MVLRGGKVDVFDPGTHGEWGQAFRNVTNTAVIDLADSQFSLDPLRMFDFDEAGAVAADHILPMIGVPADSDMENRFTLLVSPQMRESAGIGSMRSLMGYLRAQPDANNDMLLARLEAWATQPSARAIFDEMLPPYSPSRSLATIWLTNRLGLPDADDILNPHLYNKLPKGARAGMAIYGLIIETVQRHQFLHREQFSTMIFEEAAELMAYPAGARTAHKITRQGRKHATGIWLISQDYRDFERMGDKSITQKWLFAIRDPELADKTLAWFGVDPLLYPEVAQSYYEDTSPAISAEDEDSDDDAFGKVDRRVWGRGSSSTSAAAAHAAASWGSHDADGRRRRQHPTRGAGARMTSGALTLWLAHHPRVRRTVVAMTLTYTLALVGLLCAPRALAAGGSAALGWTGLHDTEGVPISFYFLSLVSGGGRHQQRPGHLGHRSE